MVLNKNQHLEAAPVTEAMIDIRVKELTDAQLENFNKLPEEFSSVFSGAGTINRQHVRMEPNTEGSFGATNNVQILGYRYEAEGGRRVVQFRKDGFTLSHLKPYTCWEDLRDEARKLYKLYLSQLNEDTSIIRIALRYINHINLPQGCELNEYLTAPPRVPDNLPQGVLQFLTLNTIDVPEHGAIARILQSSAENLNAENDSNYLPMLLDIDVIKMMKVELTADDDSIWTDFEGLRKFKNDIFFSSITTKTEELFKS